MKIKNFVFYLFYFLSFCSLCYGVFINNYRIMFICMFTLFLFLLIDFLIMIFSLNIAFHLKLFIVIFLFCSEILGEAYNFYSIISCWDSVLHFLFGCMVSYIGYLLIKNYINNYTLLFCFSFCVCLSLSIGVVWEFIEYSFDKCLQSDMQKDSLLYKFNTTYFGSTNDLEYIDDIIKTDIYTKNGVISIDGAYLDIGLYDTINDLFIGFLGTLLTSLIVCYCQTKKT